MTKYRFTEYFENEVLRKPPYLKKEWCIRVVENPIADNLGADPRQPFLQPAVSTDDIIRHA